MRTLRNDEKLHSPHCEEDAKKRMRNMMNTHDGDSSFNGILPLDLEVEMLKCDGCKCNHKTKMFTLPPFLDRINDSIDGDVERRVDWFANSMKMRKLELNVENGIDGLRSHVTDPSRDRRRDWLPTHLFASRMKHKFIRNGNDDVDTLKNFDCTHRHSSATTGHVIAEEHVRKNSSLGTSCNLNATSFEKGMPSSRRSRDWNEKRSEHARTDGNISKRMCRENGMTEFERSNEDMIKLLMQV